ncbi:hypothetical protein RZS08_63330, partial [Arthrospira platensis SPKY1]|nr:hypothetical protein [Arthrospira platensis SPKY1]
SMLLMGEVLPLVVLKTKCWPPQRRSDQLRVWVGDAVVERADLAHDQHLAALLEDLVVHVRQYHQVVRSAQGILHAGLGGHAFARSAPAHGASAPDQAGVAD